MGPRKKPALRCIAYHVTSRDRCPRHTQSLTRLCREHRTLGNLLMSDGLSQADRDKLARSRWSFAERAVL